VHAVGGTAEAKRAIAILLGVELAQGGIGFVQYFTDLPEVLVGFLQYFNDLPVGLVIVHMLGAALTSAGLAWNVISASE